MRYSVLVVALFLLAGAAVLSVLPPFNNKSDQEGTFPSEDAQYKWPSKIRRLPFNPLKNTGTDELPPSTVVDAKAQCLVECPAILPSTKTAPFS